MALYRCGTGSGAPKLAYVEISGYTNARTTEQTQTILQFTKTFPVPTTDFTQVATQSSGSFYPNVMQSYLKVIQVEAPVNPSVALTADIVNSKLNRSLDIQPSMKDFFEAVSKLSSEEIEQYKI